MRIALFSCTDSDSPLWFPGPRRNNPQPPGQYLLSGLASGVMAPRACNPLQHYTTRWLSLSSMFLSPPGIWRHTLSSHHTTHVYYNGCRFVDLLQTMLLFVSPDQISSLRKRGRERERERERESERESRIFLQVLRVSDVNLYQCHFLPTLSSLT